MSDDSNENRRSGSGPRSPRKKPQRSGTKPPRRNDRNDAPPRNQPPTEEIVDISDAEADELHQLATPDDGDRVPMTAQERNERSQQRYQESREPREPRETREPREPRREQRAPQNNPQPERQAAPPAPPKDTQGFEYSFEVGYDRQSRQYVATVLEFPELKISDVNRESAVRELEVKIDDKLLELRERNQPVPEPLGTKRYPESLSVRVSQGLFRKLDVLSRHDRHELGEMVNELLSGAVERRFEQINGRGAPPPQQQQGGRHQQQHGSRDRDRDRDRDGGHGNQKHHNKQHRNNQGQRGGRMSQSNYQNTMSNRENFMEYVRNLEKGGGTPPGGWKKR